MPNEDQTTIITKPSSAQRIAFHFFDNIRAILAILIICTICFYIAITTYEIEVAGKSVKDCNLPGEFWQITTTIIMFFFAEKKQTPPTSVQAQPNA